MKTKLKPAKHVASRKTMGETVILDLQTSVYYSLNETGTFIWDELTKGRAVDEVHDAMSREFEVEARSAKKHVDDFVGKMRREKLLIPA